MDGKRIKPTPGFKRSVCAVAALLPFLPVGAPSAATPNSEFVQAIYRGEATPQRNGVAAAADPDIERRFNDLRREILDDRSKQVDWWLAATTIFLTTISVLAVLGGYFGFRRLGEVEAEARDNVDKSQHHASEARALVKQIQEARDTAHSMVEDMSAETVKNEPDKALDIVRRVDSNPEASPLDRAVSAAIVLQNGGKMEMALEKWRAIAYIMEGSETILECRAWFSVGYLFQEIDPPNAEAAIDAYDKAISIDPTRVAAYTNRGSAKAYLGRYQDAIADHDRAIQLKPDLAEAYNNRGSAKTKLELYNEAIADHDRAIQLKPDLAEAYNNRGNAKTGLGRYNEAIADHNRAIRLKSDFAEAYNNRGNAKSKLERYDKAIADYDKAVRFKPDYAEAYSNRGNAKSSLERYDDAFADYDTAIQISPNYASAYSNRGSVKGNLGRYDEAMADYEKAIQIRPDFAEAYFNCGSAKSNLGRYDEAIADYDRAIQIKAEYAEAFYNRGIAKDRLDLAQEARSDIQSALALARDAKNDDLASRAERCLKSMS